MAYIDVATLTTDNDFRSRTTACYVTENPSDNAPVSWTNDHIWQMASSPGFGDAYAYALLSGVQYPGRDPSVISDPMILSAVQAIRSQIEPPIAPEA